MHTRSKFFPAWRRRASLLLLGLGLAGGQALAIDFGTLRLYLPPGQAPYAEITLSDASPLDPADIRARIATPDAYGVANMRYVPALQGVVLTTQGGPNGQVVLRLDRLPSGNDVPEVDLLLIVGDRMSLSLGEYRVNLRGGSREFAAAPPGTRLAGGAPAPLPAAPGPATTSPVTSNPSASADTTPLPRASTATAAPTDAAFAEAQAALDAWAAAWSSRDVDAYLAAYTPDYAGRGKASDRASWAAQRRSRILARQKISVELSNFRFARRDDKVVVTLNQSYRGDSLVERSRKRLVLVRSGQAWLIQDEEEL